MLNKVILIGRLANDPELKYTPSGIPVTTFRLAVDRPMSSEARNSGQEKQADFIDIVAWRQSAEFASNYLGKGRLVAIDGRLQIRQYVAQDGTNRRVAEVVVEQLKSLERPREVQGDGESHGNGYRGASHDSEDAPAARRPAPARASTGPARGAAPAAAEGSVEHDPFADGLDDPFADE